jgi:ketosteroid isomerase-like protein
VSTAENKALMQHIFDELAQGNSKPLVASMADDFTWTVLGTTRWSRSYRGKRAVLDELLKPLAAQFGTTYKNQAQRFIAEDDLVVVECRGEVVTTAGRPYNNSYCWICRISDGKLRELTEYLDTALVDAVIG